MRSAYARILLRPFHASWPGRQPDLGLLFGLLLTLAGCSREHAAREPAAAQAVPAASVEEPARISRSVDISPRSGWVATDFRLSIGDTIRIRAAGSVRAEASREGWVSESTGPEGWSDSRMEWFNESEDHVRVASAPRLALLGRVGAGAPYRVVSSPVLVAAEPGELMLCVNDVPAKASLASGSFHVEIEGPRRAVLDPQAEPNP